VPIWTDDDEVKEGGKFEISYMGATSCTHFLKNHGVDGKYLKKILQINQLNNAISNFSKICCLG
jgi:hypothetical protein